MKTSAAKLLDLASLKNKSIFVDTAMLAKHGIIKIVDTDETAPGVLCLTGAPQTIEELEDAQEFALFMMEQAAS